MMSTTTDTRTRLAIDVFSDVVCPWCFIGKRRLEKALRQAPDIEAEVSWRPFFLNPWVPPEGMAREQYLVTKFGSVERYAQNMPRMVAAGAQEGIAFAFEKMRWQPNTADCHRLLRWAHEEGAQAKMKERLMALYFLEGANLSDREVLVQAAVACGLKGDEVRRKLETDADLARVSQEAQQASESGISGVPFFIFGNALAVSGAQDADTLVGAMRRAIASTVN